MVINAEYDDLRPWSEAFAAVLAVAGVDVRQVVVRGLPHGFLNQSARIEPVGRALDPIAEVVAGATAVTRPAAEPSPATGDAFGPN